MDLGYPAGAMVVVWRSTTSGNQFLVLHDVDADGDGDWAWRPPSGCAENGESTEECAARELFEETGLTLALRPVATSGRWPVYTALASSGAVVTLSDEHDQYLWVLAPEAMSLVGPPEVAADLHAAIMNCR